MVLECGGNGRSFFTPPASGNQWTNGGAGCAEWTGVSLADVLKSAGVKPSGIYTAQYGADVHLSGDPKRVTLSRGVRIAKAMEPQCLLVWAMNGKPLENIHGGPLRSLTPGWPGSASHKWLTKITIRDKEHDGPGMTGTSYRVTINPMVPGSKADPKNFRIMESMPVRSIITSPSNGTKLAAGTREIKLRGASWAGDFAVKQVEVSTTSGRPGSALISASRRTSSTGSAGPQASSCRATAITKSGRRRRRERQGTAACRAGLESERLRRQSVPPDRGADRLTAMKGARARTAMAVRRFLVAAVLGLLLPSDLSVRAQQQFTPQPEDPR